MENNLKHLNKSKRPNKPTITIKPRPKKKTPRRLHDYSHELRGLAQNRWGGHRNTVQRGYGKSYGAASPGRSLEGDELAAAKKKYEPDE